MKPHKVGVHHSAESHDTGGKEHEISHGLPTLFKSKLNSVANFLESGRDRRHDRNVVRAWTDFDDGAADVSSSFHSPTFPDQPLPGPSAFPPEEVSSSRLLLTGIDGDNRGPATPRAARRAPPLV